MSPRYLRWICATALVVGCTPRAAPQRTSPPIAPSPQPDTRIHAVPDGNQASARVFTDMRDDLFNAQGRPAVAAPYLDVVGGELAIEGAYSVLRMRLRGPLPTHTPDPQLFYEWDVYLDTDANPATGGNWPLIVNDIGFEYMARLMLLDSKYVAELRDPLGGPSRRIEFRIRNDMVELRWPTRLVPGHQLDFVVSARQYGKRGAADGLQLADKAPAAGHYSLTSPTSDDPTNGSAALPPDRWGAA